MLELHNFSLLLLHFSRSDNDYIGCHLSSALFFSKYCAWRSGSLSRRARSVLLLFLHGWRLLGLRFVQASWQLKRKQAQYVFNVYYLHDRTSLSDICYQLIISVTQKGNRDYRNRDYEIAFITAMHAGANSDNFIQHSHPKTQLMKCFTK